MFKKLKSLLFQNQGTKQTIIKNIFWLSASQVGSRLLRAIIIIYAARVLGAAEYGIFSYVIGLAAFFTIFSDIGVSTILTKDVANHPEKRLTYFSTSFLIKFCLLFITAFLIIFIAPHFSKIEEANALIPWVALIVFLDGLRDFIVAYLRGRERMELEAFLIIAMNIAIVIIGFASLNISSTSQSLLFAYIISIAFSTILAFIVIKKYFFKIFLFFDKEVAIKTLNSCWPIAFSCILGAFMLNIDILMLGWWRTAAEIGYYAAGQRIVQVFYTLPGLLASGIFPTLSRLARQNDRNKLKNLNEKSMAIVFAIVFPLIAGGLILGNPIFNFLFGQEYSSGIPAFQVLMLSLLLIFPGTLITNIIIAHNQQKKFIVYVAAGAIGNVLFNALLIPKYGIIGSSIATCIALSIYYGLSWIRLKKIDNFEIFKHIKKIVIATIFMSIISFLLNRLQIQVLINIFISGLAYFAFLYLLKEPLIEEVKSILKTLKQ